MSQTSITGRIVNAQQLFVSSNGNFRKQTLIVEVVNGSYTSYLPIELHNADIDTILPTIQQGGTYTVTAYVQGSNQQMTDKNGQPTAYVSLKATSIVPVQSQLPQTSPQTAPNAFAQPQGQPNGFVAPQQANNGVNQQPQAQQAPQGFGQPQQQPQGGIGGAPQQGFGQSAQQQAPQQGFGNPPASPFGQPQQ